MDRLFNEWQEHGKLIIATDFDDTVFDFHKQGHAYNRVIGLLKECQELDFHIIILTGSHPDCWPMQTRYLEDRGIKVAAINSNPFPLPFGNHGKPYFNLLLDDRAGLGQACITLEAVLDRIKKEKTK